jgi:hypothetical protein
VRSYTPKAVFILFLSCLFFVNHHKLIIVEGEERRGEKRLSPKKLSAEVEFSSGSAY